MCIIGLSLAFSGCQRRYSRHAPRDYTPDRNVRTADRPYPPRHGLTAGAGRIYDPGSDSATLAMVTGFIMLDHDYAAPFSTPDYLRFKLEASAGAGDSPPWQGMLSINMLTMCYLDALATSRTRPYIEGGIGLMYSSRRWKGQGLHFTHNPVAGMGVHITPGGEAAGMYQINLRFIHASNGGLHSDNRGMNAILLATGYVF